MFGQYSNNSRGPQSHDKVAHDSEYNRVRSVFDNAQVAHVWAQQNQSFGRSHNGHFYFEGPTIYSYGSHFPIATFLDVNISGKRVVLVTEARYSVTTSQHQGDVAGALRGRGDVLLIRVPDLAKLSAWGADANKLDAATLDAIRLGFIRQIAHLDSAIESDREEIAKGTASEWRTQWAADHVKERDNLLADYRDFGRAFKYRRKLPTDCRAFLASKEEKAKRAKFDSKVADARNVAKRVGTMLDNAKSFESLPALGELSSYQIEERLRVLLNAKAQLDKARHWLSRGKAGDAPKRAVARGRKRVAELLASWTAFQEESRVHAHDASVIQTAAHIVADATREPTAHDPLRSLRAFIPNRNPGGSDSNAWRLVGGNGSFAIGRGDLEVLLSDVVRLGPQRIASFESVVAWIMREIQTVLYMRDIGFGSRPEWYYSRKADRRTIEELRAAWINGERVDSYQIQEPTLVRRKGEMLETSRGASAPFSQAVAIYVAASRCKRDGRTWKRNGERMRVGSFELDSIDASGNIRVGCHAIAFDEMTRLAVREGVAVPTFPVPACVQVQS